MRSQLLWMRASQLAGAMGLRSGHILDDGGFFRVHSGRIYCIIWLLPMPRSRLHKLLF